jgi:uncharacterized protein YjiS (DUF1127 family)
MATATVALGILVPGSERTIGTRIGSLRAAWNKHRAYRASLAELAALTERQLTDIGTNRATLERFARAAIHGI